MYNFKSTVLLNTGTVVFEGENQITIEQGVFDEMPKPLDELYGTVWVDSQGVVYKYDASTLTASVAYVPFGLTEVTIPQSITPEDNVTCTVNAVDSYAFKLAEDLQTLTFENPAIIESISAYGMAYCDKLSQVNGKTTVEEATATFTNEDVNIGYRIFHNTALGNLSGQGVDMTFIDGKKELEIISDNTQPMYISIYDNDGSLWTSETDIGMYKALTGNVLSVNMSVGGSDVESQKIYRVYFQTSELDASMSIAPNDTVTINGTEVTCYATDSPDIIYVEFIPNAGTTVNISIEVSYLSPSSCGGNLKVWGMIMTPQESEENKGKIIDCETVEATENTNAYTKAIQAYWVTQPDDFSVTKASSGNTGISLVGDGNGNIVAGSNISYTITYSRVSDSTSSYGRDYVKTVDFTDYIDFSSLPEIDWNSHIIEAIKAGECHYANGTFYVENTAIANISVSGANLSRGSLEYDENKGVCLKWSVYNSKTTAEIATTKITLTIYKDAVNLDPSLLQDEVDTNYEFINNIEAVTHYTYSEDKTSTSSAAKYFTLSKGQINISSSYISNTYLGGTLDYTNRVYNSGAMTYEGDEGAIYTLKDDLDNKTYIKPENMELMFNDEFGKNLTITISNAVISEWSEVTSVNGETAYINAANSNIESTTDTLVIRWNTDYTALEIERADGTVIAVDNSLKETLFNMGYTVGFKTAFSLIWTLNDENEQFKFSGGQQQYYYVYASMKDTFQLLDRDYPNCYPTESANGFFRNNVKLLKSTGSSQVASTGVSSHMKREAYLSKSISSHNSDDNIEGVPQLDEVLDNKIEFIHIGNGSYENLPMVDVLYGSQVLLVPAELNPTLTDKGLKTVVLSEDDTDVTYYCLSQAGTYKNLTVGVDDNGNNLIADTVTVTSSDTPIDVTIGDEEHSYTGLSTEIKWYFSETIDDYFYSSVLYHTFVDAELMNSSTYSVGGVAYMNDRTSDRIYTTLWGEGSLLDSDKEIVTLNDDGSYTADDDDYTVISSGETVTYRLTFSNPNEYTYTLKGTDFYDALPTTESLFNWEKDVNISVSWDNTEDAEVTNLDKWYIDDEMFSIVIDGKYYIKWTDDTVVNIAAGKQFCVYVTLTYPEDTDENELYSEYCKAVNGNRIENALYVYNSPSSVYHSLKDIGKVLLQKGVYATYRYVGNTYTKTPSRVYYNNADSTGRAVSYYAVIYNGGNSRLYLQNIYDILPSGFTYNKLINNQNANGLTNTYTTTPSTNPYSIINVPKTETVQYKNATVSATSKDNVLTFSVSAGSGNSAIKYDETEKKYYLDYGEAIVFGYVCTIGDTTLTEDNAVNTIGMEYYDYLDAGVKMIGKEDISVKGITDDFYVDQNDGSRSIKSSDDIRNIYSFATDSNVGTQWLLSDVTISRGGIVPGVTCYTDSYTDSGSTEAKPYTTSVSPFAAVNWKARLHNSGTNTITDYTFKDELPSPYGLTGSVSMSIYDKTSTSPVLSYTLFIVSERHDDEGYINVKSTYNNSNYKLSFDGTTVSIPVAYQVNINVSLTRDNNLETLKIDFENSVFSIPENDGYVDIILSGKNVTTEYENTVYTNHAYLIPNVQEYSNAAQGSLLYDEGSVAGVANTSPVTISTGYSTRSKKSVAEIDNSDNCTNSDADKKYIVLDSKNSLFEYTLTVTNDTSFGMTKLIMIDSLPQLEDHSPFDNHAYRLSEFKVSLAEQPNFNIVITTTDGESYVLDSQYYTIEYSDKTDFTDGDWNGSLEWSEWSADSTDVRSIRLFIKDDSGTQIPAGATIEFSFNAKIDDELASAGMIAWNSFGYHYGLTGVGYELEAVPLSVGVKIPYVPVLQKKLVDLRGNEYKATETTEFNFLIYTGNEIEGSFDSTDELIEALNAENRTYRQVDLSVAVGESKSEKLKLEFNDWIWNKGDSYTIVEICNNPNYKQSDWNNISIQSFTFTYDPDVSTALSCTDVWQRWSFDISKVDGTDEQHSLEGAVFAIYSEETGELLSDEKYASLSYQPDKNITDSEGTAWYLYDVRTTDKDGKIPFENLLAEKYYIVEIKSPDGYKLDWEPRIIDNSFMFSDVVVENYSMTVLPNTSGTDIDVYAVIIILIVGVSFFVLTFKLYKNKYSQSDKKHK